MLNLDTHILIHALEGQLTQAEEQLLARDEWSISAIVLCELAKLSQLGRIDLDLDDPDVVDVILRVHVWPLTLEICKAIRSLDFKSDPADELIAATSIVHGVPLVTRDRRILASKLVPFA
ncbi:MAG TPA: PIN domain-containing protein [Phycisphaerae bacterium]|jgi:PIN domain nuclease of toxin-antitoxin system|nr:type II toxin-antitoxin system VapC family toxin [Phycisphaerae bacterium]HOB74820.1 PIN domain-containing protein [Phycisphaerae bacterium]HOJ54345.1 PIN domain-containing protein [Phycisphaerae bacterium]HOL26816.1 PIN domain-containing protein [Phycisphaerae bacterium]HPP19977.1 PIN domain-containing protein [Phycisphaerae bacterium]